MASAPPSILRPMMVSAFSSPHKYGVSIFNHRAYATPDKVEKYRLCASGKATGIYTSTSETGYEHTGPVGGIYRPQSAGLWPNQIAYRIAGKFGKSKEEIARSACNGAWFLTPDTMDDLWRTAHSISLEERRAIFDTEHAEKVMVDLWRSRLAIGSTPSEPVLVKCRVRRPIATWMGPGNPVALGYGRGAKDFPTLYPNSRYSQIFIPGVLAEDGSRFKESDADKIDLNDAMEILAMKELSLK